MEGVKNALWAIVFMLAASIAVAVWLHYNTTPVYKHTSCQNTYDLAGSGRQIGWNCTLTK